MAKSSTSGQGRPKGSANKNTAEIKQYAAQYGQDAVDRLAWLMKNAENQQTQAFASAQLLDRGFGKAQQNINVTETPFDSLSLEDQRALREALSVVAGGSETDAGGPEPTHH